MSEHSRDWENDLFPEASQKPLRDTTGIKTFTHTLNSLGVRTPDEARKLGFVPIRPYIDRFKTGLWVHEDDLPALDAIAQQVAAYRAEQDAKRRAQEEEARALREQKRQLAASLLVELAFLTPEEREGALSWAQEQPETSITLDRLLIVLRPRVIRRLADEAGVPLTDDAQRIALGNHTVQITLWGESRQTALKLGNAPLPAEATSLTPSFDADTARKTLKAAYETALGQAIAKEEDVLVETVGWLEQHLDRLPEAQRETWTTAARTAFEQEISDPRKIAREMERLAERLHFDHKLNEARAARTWVQIAENHRQVVISATQRVTLELGDNTHVTTISVALMTEAWNRLLRDAPTEEFVRAAEQAAAEALAKKEAAWRDFEVGVQTLLAEAARTPGYPTDNLQELVSSVTKRLQVKKLRSAFEEIRRIHRDHMKTAEETQAIQAAVEEHNLSSFKDHFALARSMDRSFTLFVGPTNSGKTYHALNELVKYESGVYLAPLRLLALEGQEELEQRGVTASYLTGEERDMREGARFLSATIEMLNTDTPVDAAVIDEAQLLADRDRGWAWSRAVLGVPARHVILTGSPDCVPLLEALCAYTGEPLKVVRLPRLTPLKVLPQHVPLERVKPGTALIAFSRRNVLGLKQALEGTHRVAVIYGNLSPDVRREEARRFRSGEAEVLVATDAIAMGLNLPIETVLFFETEKFNGEEVVPLARSEILQIGGRAGRFGKYETGYVGTVSVNDRKRVKVAFTADVPLPDLPPVATVQPSFTHIEALSAALRTEVLSDILNVFRERMYFDSPALVPASMNDIRDLARVVDAAPLSLQDKFVFATAPVDARNTIIRAQFENYVWAFAKGHASGVPTYGISKRGEGSNDDRLFRAEVAVKNLTLYAWLAYRYPEMFPDLERCNDVRRDLNALIESLLKTKGMTRRCSECGKSLPPMHSHGRCDACYRRGWRGNDRHSRQ